MVLIADFFAKFDGESLTYDDIIFLPQYVDFGIDQIQLSSQLTERIKLNIPIISSPMDTVTEAELATAVALQGGLGIIHYNMSPEAQLAQVVKVKRYQNGFISEPIVLSPRATIRDVVKMRKEIGYSIVPITRDGLSHGELMGMITKYDYSTFSEEDLDKSVEERMIPIGKLPVATYEELSPNGVFNLAQANQILLDSHNAALPIVDKEGNLRSLITRSDLDKHQTFPHAVLDRSSRLVVGAAVETWPNKAQERIEMLQEHVDIIVFDTSQGYTQFELDLIRWTKRHFPHLDIVGGNVVTAEATEALIKAGADVIRVGMGSGSICTTQEVGGIGRGQATAIYDCGRVCRQHGKSIIADGGVKTSSDIVKALCLGATSVMLGSLLACTLEAPGKTHIRNGVRLKEYRGMGSLKAMEMGSAVRYGTQNSCIRIPEGVSGMISARGTVQEWLQCLLQGVKQGLHKLGYKQLDLLKNSIANNKLHLERRSEAAKREGQVHSLYEVGTETVSVGEVKKSSDRDSAPSSYECALN